MAENTQSLIFSELQEWYLSDQGQAIGPFTGAEVLNRIAAGRTSYLDYVYREKEGKWIRLADHELFQEKKPTPPSPPKATKVVPPPPAVQAEKPEWFVFYSDQQSGPYLKSEVEKWILEKGSEGKLNADQAWVWKEGQSGWEKLSDHFKVKVTTQTQAALSVAEKRAFPRKPLSADVYVTDQKRLANGICRDVSIGGMQVLVSPLPSDLDQEIALHVNPPSDSKIKPFVAKGKVVRVLEDRRGFSFRFTELSHEARTSIDAYIQSQES